MKGHTNEQLQTKCDALKHAVSRFATTYGHSIECDEAVEMEIESLYILMKEAKAARKELKERKEEQYPMA